MREQIAAKKAELDRIRGRAPLGLRNFEQSHDLELTYTSNAIEGNTLTASETMLVVEQGITVGGKPLRDHLEAIDLFEALRYVRGLAGCSVPISEMDVRTLHRLVMLRSEPDMAGRYADQGRFVLRVHGRHSFPSPAEVPPLLGDFATWLAAADDTPGTGFTAHRRLVEVHPFNDGNGRTARLLMNLVLLRAGYPPIAIRPQNRLTYLAALDAGGTGPFETLMFERLDATLDEYLAAARRAL